MLRPTVSQAWFSVIVILSIAAMPAHAIEVLKFSDFQDGHQIWFEVEDFDQRSPDTNDDYVLQNDPLAFGTEELNIINRAGGDGGRITYSFDISVGGGLGGDWFHWGRVINPNNQSDYLLVEGDPEDVIPTDPPFDENTVGALQPTGNWVDDDHRIFENSIGPPWSWSGGDDEGQRKQLTDGVNTMHIFNRQGNDTVSWDVMMWSDNPDYEPTDEDYSNALTFVENPGDFNSDGNINLDDFMIMAENFSEKFPFAEAISKGDVDGDTIVDLVDFIAFVELFNSPGAVAAGVPEPAGMTLAGLAFAATLFAMFRSRRQSRSFLG